MKPVIIVGAGASYDYVHTDHLVRSNDWRPPLTNDLFNVRKYESVLLKYPETMELASDALRKIPHMMSFEEYLTGIRDKRASTDANRQRQLVSLSFYLQHLFHDISANYGSQPTNNYRALLGAIKDNGGEACIVSFNYDNLLEQNIPEINDKIDSYLNSAVKVIKPHGSYDWVYPISLDSYYKKSSYEFLMDNPWYITMPENQNPQLYPLRKLHHSNKYFDRQYGQRFYPAIAIPLANKESYVCPDSHVKHLTAAINNTDRILIIGWKAGDKNLVSLLEKEIRRQVRVTVVSSGSKSASEIIKKLEHIPQITFVASNKEGFTNFLRSEESDEFFTK
jgi:hypothetical protein